MLKIIKDLGLQEINSIRKDTGAVAKKRFVLIKCFCGKEFRNRMETYKRGAIFSCGCVKKQQGKKTHGKTNTRIYGIWGGMKTRVTNRNRKQAKDYIGRGIVMCQEWMTNFSNFYEWSINNGYQDDLTIDRINNDGNYEPDNCRWITIAEQQQNKRK